MMAEPAKIPSGTEMDMAISGLIARLADRDGLVRARARDSLVAFGPPAAPALAEALRSRNATVRWEAAKALTEIGTPAIAPALVRALGDRDFGIRWLAAEGLVALGEDGLPPLLEALMRDPDADWLYEGAHHVLSVLSNRGMGQLVDPVLAALDRYGTENLVPQAAARALGQLQPRPE